MTGRFVFASPRTAGRDCLGNVTERLAALNLMTLHWCSGILFADPDAIAFVECRAPCVVLGTVFRRSDNRQVVETLPGLGNAVAESGGQHLIDHYWGGYVALFANSRSPRGFALRDPSAHVPLYRWSCGDYDLYFNDFALACRAAGIVPPIDWPAIAHRLRFPQLRIEATGLCGIEEIMPGCRVSFEDGARRLLWSPWTFASRPFDNAVPSDVLATELETVLDQCATTWRDIYGSVQLELSGGLDSSILAACLAGRESTLHCVTYATESEEGDERRYSRAVCDFLGLPLSEHVVRSSLLDPTARLDVPRPRPGGFVALAGLDRLLGDTAVAAGAEAIVSGAGGDNVFCGITTVGPVIDALRLAGVGEAWRAARNVADLCDTTIGDVARHIWRLARRGKAHPLWPPTDETLSETALVPCIGHPWLEAPPDALPGKRAHIAGLMRILPYLDGYDRGQRVPIVAPLMAQPVLEFCLRVPSFRWIEAGRNRSLARLAFAHRLPSIVIDRRTKGGLRTLFMPAYERHREELKDLLCDGRLADAGLIDRNAMRTYLAAPLSPARPDYLRAFEIADVELWVRDIERLASGSGAI